MMHIFEAELPESIRKFIEDQDVSLALQNGEYLRSEYTGFAFIEDDELEYHYLFRDPEQLFSETGSGGYDYLDIELWDI